MSDISLGAIDLPDGVDTVPGSGRVLWADRDSYPIVGMTYNRTLGNRLVFSQQTYPTGRPITLQLTGHAWLTETAKDALLALSHQGGEHAFLWFAESYTVVFDHTEGEACSFSKLPLGAGFSLTNWVGTIRLLTSR